MGKRVPMECSMGIYATARTVVWAVCSPRGIIKTGDMLRSSLNNRNDIIPTYDIALESTIKAQRFWSTKIFILCPDKEVLGEIKSSTRIGQVPFQELEDSFLDRSISAGIQAVRVAEFGREQLIKEMEDWKHGKPEATE